MGLFFMKMFLWNFANIEQIVVFSGIYVKSVIEWILDLIVKKITKIQIHMNHSIIITANNSFMRITISNIIDECFLSIKLSFLQRNHLPDSNFIVMSFDVCDDTFNHYFINQLSYRWQANSFYILFKFFFYRMR